MGGVWDFGLRDFEFRICGNDSYPLSLRERVGVRVRSAHWVVDGRRESRDGPRSSVFGQLTK